MNGQWTRRVVAYVVVAVIICKSQSTRIQLRLDLFFFAVPPWHGNDLAIIFPWLLRQYRSHEKLHVLEGMTHWTAYAVDCLLAFHAVRHLRVR